MTLKELDEAAREKYEIEISQEPEHLELICDLLSLACVEVTPDVVGIWSRKERGEAAKWAAAVHAAASDNIVAVPLRPMFLDPYYCP
jgi:hypothetical protein